MPLLFAITDPGSSDPEADLILSSLDAKIAKYEQLVEQNKALTDRRLAEEEKTRQAEIQTQQLYRSLLDLMADLHTTLQSISTLPADVQALSMAVNQLIGQTSTYKAISKTDTTPKIDITIQNNQEMESSFEFLGTVAEKDLLKRIEATGPEDIDELDKIKLPDGVLDIVAEVVGMVVPQAKSVLKVGQMLAAFYKIRK